jgi:hypothetical protein
LPPPRPYGILTRKRVAPPCHRRAPSEHRGLNGPGAALQIKRGTEVGFKEDLARVLADPEVTRCIYGHDHRVHPVVGSFHDKRSPGKMALSFFHCPQCVHATGAHTRRRNSQQHATIQAAIRRGNVLPCTSCFPKLKKWLDARLSRV